MCLRWFLIAFLLFPPTVYAQSEFNFKTTSVRVPNQALAPDMASPTNADDIAAAQSFATAFQGLVAVQSWVAVAAIVPMRTAFNGFPVLQTPDFIRAWSSWERHSLAQTWVIDDDKLGIWRTEDVSESAGKLLPQTLGIRLQPDGRWWMILVRTRDRPGQGVWRCQPTCPLKIYLDGKEHAFIARPPLGQQWSATDAIGFPLPIKLLKDASFQRWEIKPPGEDQKASFDMSWWPSLCVQLLASCPK